MNRLLVGLVLSLAVLAFGLPEGAVAQGVRPNLNGVWQLNVAESDFGQVEPPVKQSEEVTQAGEEMAIAVSMERPEAKQKYTLRFRVGGGETPMEMLFPAGAPFRILSVKGEWKGAVLVVTERLQFQGMDGNLESKYQLTAGGKKLKKTTHVAMSGGSLDTTTVYDKE